MSAAMTSWLTCNDTPRPGIGRDDIWYLECFAAEDHKILGPRSHAGSLARHLFSGFGSFCNRFVSTINGIPLLANISENGSGHAH